VATGKRSRRVVAVMFVLWTALIGVAGVD